MSLATKFRVLSSADLNRVHEATVRVLEETGIGFQEKEVQELFKKHGAKVEGEIVYISRKMLEDALKTVPSTFKWWARNEANSIVVGGEQERTHISPNSGPVYVQDLDNGRRLGKMEDVVNLYKLAQASSVVNTVGHIPVNPSDVGTSEKSLTVFYNLLKNTDKPLIGYESTPEEIRKIFEMIEITMGQKGYLLDHPAIAISVNPLSPLRFDDKACQRIVEYAKYRQPVMILSCALAGVSAPVNILGSAVLQNAEMLAGLVLTQIANAGSPYIYSPASTVANMQKGSYITGTPEANLINVACIQLAQELYEIPCRSMAGLTDAKTIDCQSGYETMQNLFMLMLSGVHVINECVGVLDSIMTTSYEKFIIDEEMMSRILCVMRGVDTSEDALSVDVIKEIGQAGSYLMHPNTFEHFRERWTPTVSDWNSYDNWKEQGSEDVAIRANRKYKEILEKAPESLLDKELDLQLQNYVNKAINK